MIERDLVLVSRFKHEICKINKICMCMDMRRRKRKSKSEKNHARIRFAWIVSGETVSVCSNNDNKFYCNCAIPFKCRKKLSKCEKVHCSLIWIAKYAIIAWHYQSTLWLFPFFLSFPSIFPFFHFLILCTSFRFDESRIIAIIIIINTRIWRVVSQ